MNGSTAILFLLPGAGGLLLGILALGLGAAHIVQVLRLRADSNPLEIDEGGAVVRARCDLHSMSWENAPVWATHIVSWRGDSENCFWSECRGGRYFCQATREAGVASFGMVDEQNPNDTFGWIVRAQRPLPNHPEPSSHTNP